MVGQITQSCCVAVVCRGVHLHNSVFAIPFSSKTQKGREGPFVYVCERTSRETERRGAASYMHASVCVVRG